MCQKIILMISIQPAKRDIGIQKRKKKTGGIFRMKTRIENMSGG